MELRGNREEKGECKEERKRRKPRKSRKGSKEGRVEGNYLFPFVQTRTWRAAEKSPRRAWSSKFLEKVTCENRSLRRRQFSQGEVLTLKALWDC